MAAMIEESSIAPRVPNLRIRIVLVEDHEILREGLKALIDLERDFEIAGDFGDAATGLAGICRLQPDLVLMDLCLPGISGFELLAQIRHVAPRARNLVLTAHNSEENIRAALNAGAHGYILKEANRAELMLAIRTVSAGERYLCKAVATQVLSGYLSGSEPRHSPKSVQSITGREREVLTRIAHGESNKVIARSLALSVKTIEKHRSNLMRKLHLHNAAAITLFAVRNGLTVESRLPVQFDAGTPQSASVG
jgi:DNA-binding NarL/FixJ family response regulator